MRGEISTDISQMSLYHCQQEPPTSLSKGIEGFTTDFDAENTWKLHKAWRHNLTIGSDLLSEGMNLDDNRMRIRKPSGKDSRSSIVIVFIL